MKLTIYALLSCLFLLFLGTSVSAASWDSVGQALQKYLLTPSTENAAALYDALPAEPGELTIDNDTTDLMDSIYDNLGVLQAQVEDADRNAVGVAYRLYAIADSGFAEELNVILGHLIRINPQIFLEELNNHRNLVPSLTGITGNFGPEFTQSPVIMRRETRMRARALESITADSLAPLRDSCVVVLKKSFWWDRLWPDDKE